MTQLSFDSPSKFILSLSIILLTLSISTLFLSTDKLLPIQMKLYEDMYISKAKLTIATQQKKQEEAILAQAKLDASILNKNELAAAIDTAGYISIHSLQIGVSLLPVSLAVYLIELYIKISKPKSPAQVPRLTRRSNRSLRSLGRRSAAP